MSAKMEPIPEYGDLMTMEDFLECVRSGGFIDYDGYGCYSDGNEMSDISVVPSEVPDEIDMSWTHVVWFNK